MISRTRATLGLGAKDLTVFLAYCLTLCVAIPFYHPWEDEGLSWLIARDHRIYEICAHILRHEGHPALWYLVLWLPVHLHLPYLFINWFTACIAVAGIYIFLRHSPFPFYLRAILPFGFALAWQYAIVARSYTLFPLACFLAAHYYRQKPARPIAFAAALAALANISFHGAIVAIALAIAYAWLSHRQAIDARKDTQIGVAIFAGSLVFMAACIWPTSKEKLPFTPATTKALQRFVIPAPQSPTPQPAAVQSPVPQPVTAAVPKRPFLVRVVTGLRPVIAYPVSSSYPLAVLVDILLVIYLYRRKQLILLLAPALLALFLLGIFIKIYHLPLIWIALLTILWIVWDDSISPTARNLQNILGIFLAAAGISQIIWTVQAIHYETTQSTYPSAPTAAYLHTLPPGKRIDGYDLGITIAPYFAPGALHRISIDIPPFDEILAGHPDLIVFTTLSLDESQSTYLDTAGYKRTKTFCGAPFYPDTPPHTICLVVYEGRYLNASTAIGVRRQPDEPAARRLR